MHLTPFFFDNGVFGFKTNQQKTVIKTNSYEKCTFRNKGTELFNLLRISNHPPFTTSILKDSANFETLSVILKIGKIYPVIKFQC